MRYWCCIPNDICSSVIMVITFSISVESGGLGGGDGGGNGGYAAAPGGGGGGAIPYGLEEAGGM